MSATSTCQMMPRFRSILVLTFAAWVLSIFAAGLKFGRIGVAQQRIDDAITVGQYGGEDFDILYTTDICPQ